MAAEVDALRVSAKLWVGEVGDWQVSSGEGGGLS